MVQMRTFRLTWVAALLALLLAGVATLSNFSGAYARSNPPRAEATGPLDDMQQGGLIDTITGKKTPSAAAGTVTATVTATPEALEVVIVTPTPAVSPTPTGTAPTGVNATNPALVTNPQGVIEGTVIANRTNATVQFFVEGKTWQLDPLRSAGVNLARSTAVLNLLNCDATSADQSDCFWDPYLLQRDGFYEVVTGAEEGAQVNLVLRTAGAPPTDQIWIQNRLESAEQVYFGAEMRELAPASVTEFTIDPATPSIFYLRTCIVTNGDSTCEWNAAEAQAGTYYALTDETWQSGVPGASVIDLQLSPILGAGVDIAVNASAPEAGATATTTGAESTSTATAGATTDTAAPAASTGSIVCTLAVPTLNVRSGPGLAFDVISKIMTTGDTPATVTVVGRTESAEWLQVDERQANGGWIINGNAYITCPTDTLALAVISGSALPPTPTPAPVVASPVTGDSGAGDGSTGEVTTTDGMTETVSAPATSSAPAGLALLIVQNSFEQPLRFTLDQRYRVAEGPSEVDLAPGQSTSFVVFPGVVAFSASSAWRSLSGNAEMLLEADQEQPLYLIFVPDPGEEGKWIFQY